MADIDIFKRKMFGGLTPSEFQEVVDYSKSYGGIPELTVNRNITAQDVMSATPYLSQPTGGTTVEAVSNFNNFLAGILSNKFARVDQEKQALKEANTAATDRVFNTITELNKEKDLKDQYMEVDGNLIDLKALQAGGSDYMVYEKPKDDKIKDQFMVVDNDLVDLRAEGGPKKVIENIDQEKLTDRYKIVGNDVIDLQALANNPEDINGAIVYDGEGKPSDAARFGELIALKKKYEADGVPFPSELQGELDFLTPKETKPYESKEQQLFSEKKFEVVASSEAAETQYQTILDAEKLLMDPKFTTGVLTSNLTPVQEFFGRFFGVDIDELLEGVNIDVLNNPSDTAALQKATTQLAMNVLGTGKLPGAISDFEFRQMMNSVFNVDSPKLANERFLQGMKYLYQKDIAKGRIIATIDSSDPQALVKYQDALMQWDEENRPKYLPSATYLSNILENLPPELQ